MQNRALPFAVIIASVTAIAVTALPWFNLNRIGIEISWNGLGIASDQVLDLAPNGRGWLIVAACVITGLTGLVALMPSPSAKPLARMMAGVSTGASALATLVPIVIWIWPSWYFGSFQDHLELPDDAPIGVNKLILGFLILTLILLTGLCAGLFIERSEGLVARQQDRRTSSRR
ncbi:hypothetical protein [Gordonia phthalatica]|uniref:Uncharacterized protein n=1 Tax=Gordonia phthalatica TaxID=1136941 RepID=A0A0N9NA41_9ACTN|nr:hypothetical protein [Gordonia phthalatica]ALG84196.1 hypothetical protein ACH46_06345 [Gordonia phthalatica]